MSATKTTRDGMLRSAAHLTQPPHFRTGREAAAPAAPMDMAAAAALNALRASQFDRTGRASNRSASKAGF